MPHQEVTQTPVSQVGVWESIRAVECVINGLDAGIFFEAAYLAERVLRDDRVYTVVMTRVGALLGKPLELEPATDTATARRINDQVEDEWSSMFSQAALVRLQTWGLMLGVGLGEIEEEGDTWKLKVWHPHGLQWDTFRQVFTLQVLVVDERDADGAVLRSHPERITLQSDGKGGFFDDTVRGTRPRRWVLYTPFGYEDACRQGLLNKLARLFVSRQEPYRDRSRYSEKHGNPMHLGVAPTSATKEEMEAFARQLDDLGSSPVVVARQGEPGNAWDVKLIEALGKSHELFLQTIEQLSGAIADVVLGQSQSTDGQAGLGSNAQAGEPVRLDVMRFDAEGFTDMLRTQFLMPVLGFWGKPLELTPYPCYQVDPPEDRAALAAVHAAQATADKTYIDAGVLTPEEVAISRFGAEEYSLDTTIDTESREAIQEISAEQMKVEAEKALEAAKNPPDPSEMMMQPGAQPSNGKPNGKPVAPPA